MTAIRRPSRRLDTAPQRLLSMGLATATAVGLVGVLAVRSAEDASANTDDNGDSASVATTDGRTQADLDAYAAQLDAERQRLQDYRDQLVAVAATLQQRANALASGDVRTSIAPTKVRLRAPKVPAPRAKAAPNAPAPRAQAKSKSS